MGWQTFVPIVAALACSVPGLATAQEKAADAVSAIPAKELTREQFQALAPDAVIEINGRHERFQARSVRGLYEAAKQLQDIRARLQAAFGARRNALIEKRKAMLVSVSSLVAPEGRHCRRHRTKAS